MLLAALVATCAAYAPTYARAVDQAVLRSLVDASDPRQTTTSLSRPRTLSEPELMPEAITEALPPSLLALSGEPVAGMRYAQQVVPAPGKKPSPVVLRSREGMCDHLEIAGRCATKAGELLVSAADARAWGWREGTVLRLYQEKHDRLDDERPDLELTVVGTYTVPDDPGYWLGSPPDGKSGVPQPDLDNLPGVDDLLTPAATFAGTLPTATLTVDLPLDRSAVTLNSLPAAVEGLAALRTEHPEVAVDQPLSRRLAQLRASQEQTAIIVPLVMTQLALLAIVALYLVARGAVDQRRHDLALTRLRGRSGGGARRLVLAELGMCALVGVPLGVLAGVLLAWLTAALTLPAVPREVPAAVVPWGLGALAASLGMVVLATRGVHREPVSSLLRAARPRRGGRAVEVTVGLLALSVVAGVALGVLTGPVTLAAPVLTALGMALLASALLPRAAAWVGARAVRRGAVVPTLAAGGVGRRPGPRRVLVGSTVGVALAVFATTCVVVADANRLARAELETGAPAVLTVAAGGPRDLLATAEAVRSAGVEVSPVVTIGQSDPEAPWTLAVDPGSVARVANPSAIRGLPLDHVRTSGQESILLRGDRLTGTVTWDLAGRGDDAGTARLRLEVTTDQGQTRLRDLVDLDPRGQGSRELDVPLLCQGECRLGALVVEWTPPSDAVDVVLDGLVTLADLEVDGRAVDLGGAGTWAESAALPTAPATHGEGTSARDAQIEAEEVTTDHLVMRVQAADGADVRLGVTDVPRPLPVVATRGIEGSVVPDRLTVMTPDGLQTDALRQAQVDVLPAVTDRGVLVDLTTLARLGGGFDERARPQLWLADRAAVDRARSVLEAEGVPLRSVATTAEAERGYDESASGWGLRLAALAGVVGLLLAALVAVVTAVTGWRQVVRDGASLLLSGVSPAAVRSAIRAEQVVVALVAILLGTFAGLVGGRIALPSVPLFVDGVLVPEPTTAIPWVPVGLTVLGSAALLLGAALVIGRALAARTRPDAAREVA